MSPDENNLKIAQRLRDRLNNQLAQNTNDQQDAVREIDASREMIGPARTNVDNVSAAAKAACQEAEDWSRHLILEPDGGSIPQHETLKDLQEKAAELNQARKIKLAILERCEANFEIAQDRLSALKDQRKVLIVDRDRAIADVEKLLKS
jgi:hypothetical protein